MQLGAWGVATSIHKWAIYCVFW